MNTKAFKLAYYASRNGANHLVRNFLYPKFLYSDGVAECANAGCHWLLDILGTELPGHFAQREGAYSATITVHVSNNRARITAEFLPTGMRPWIKHVPYTDMPPGKWVFFVDRQPDNGFICILPSEY